MDRLAIFMPKTASARQAIVFSLLAFFVLPSVIGAQWTNILTSAACFAVAAAGVAFLYGRVGMVSLTQVGLMGVGGWVMLRLSHGTDLPFEINLILAGGVTMVFGAILAFPALRLRGLYLALITLMAAGGFEILFATYQFPNGGEGFWGVQTGTEVGVRRPTIATSDTGYLRFTIAVSIACFLLIEWNRRSKPGRAWAMLRQSEAAAMAASVNVVFHKLWAFALSGLIAGFAGALLAGSIGLLDPSTFRASESILLFALAIVGGARFWQGALIAAVLYRILPALLNDWGLDPDLAFIIFGAGLLHALITAPDGIAGQIFGNRAVAKGSTDGGLSIAGLSVRYGGVVALEPLDVSFTKPVVGIIGPNGAGKTTLMNAFSGFVSSTGHIDAGGTRLSSLAPHKRSQWGLRRSFQKAEIAEDLSVRQNIQVQLDGAKISASERDKAISIALDFVGLDGQQDTLAGQLSGFERRLVDLAKAVVGSPRIVMLDEPAGGLSSDETEKLGDLILGIHAHCGAQTLLIDHDVDLVKRVCGETLVLNFGRKIAFGPVQEVFTHPDVVAAYLGGSEK